MSAKNRNNEEAAHVRDLKASKRPRGKHSPEWSKLKKVRAENRASKDDGVYRRQITLADISKIPAEHHIENGVLVCEGHMCDLDGTIPYAR